MNRRQKKKSQNRFPSLTDHCNEEAPARTQESLSEHFQDFYGI